MALRDITPPFLPDIPADLDPRLRQILGSIYEELDLREGRQAKNRDARFISMKQESWIPNIDTNAARGTFKIRNGQYARFGNVCTIWFLCDAGASGGGQPQWVSGLPYPVAKYVASKSTLGAVGAEGPGVKDLLLAVIAPYRDRLYIYNGGTSENTAVTIASGFATYPIDE